MRKQTEDEDDDVVRDRQSVVVRMDMMDSSARSGAAMDQPLLHAPGQARTSSADREARAARVERYNTRLADAWKNIDPEPVAIDAHIDAPERVDDPAWVRAYNARIESAWKGAES